MTQVADRDSGLATQSAYDHQGARVLRRDSDQTRTRNFFHGLTEEVVKESVAGAHTDDAFTFTLEEDGELAAGMRWPLSAESSVVDRR